MIKFDYHELHEASTENHKIYVFVITHGVKTKHHVALHVLGELWYIKERSSCIKEHSDVFNKQCFGYGYASESTILIKQGDNFSKEIELNEIKKA